MCYATLFSLVSELLEARKTIHELQVFDDPEDSDGLQEQNEQVLNFVMELIDSLIISLSLVIPISWLNLIFSCLYTLYSFQRDAAKYRKEPPLTKMEISEVCPFSSSVVFLGCVCHLFFDPFLKILSW